MWMNRCLQTLLLQDDLFNVNPTRLHHAHPILLHDAQLSSLNKEHGLQLTSIHTNMQPSVLLIVAVCGVAKNEKRLNVNLSTKTTSCIVIFTPVFKCKMASNLPKYEMGIKSRCLPQRTSYHRVAGAGRACIQGYQSCGR